MPELSNSDWINLITVAVAILALYFSNRGRINIEAFFMNTSTHPIPGTSTWVNTHSVLIRNTGNQAATGIHLIHEVLPDAVSISVYPQLHFARTPFKADNADVTFGGEIVFDRLRPKEQYVFSYMYPAPIRAHDIRLNIRHDQGYGSIHDFPNVTPYLPKYKQVIFVLLMAVGFLVVTYYLVKLLVATVLN